MKEPLASGDRGVGYFASRAGPESRGIVASMLPRNRWFVWTDPAGQSGHIRGVDVFRVRDGLILEKLSYVKG